MIQLDFRLDALVELDRQVDAAEDDGIRARWEFGRELLAERVGKQLPKGRLEAICEATGKSRSEVQYRVQFAEHYATAEQLSTVVDTFKSWTEIRDALKVHVGQNSGEYEWFTPQPYIDAAVAVMGAIDLDPASTAVANQIVKAAKFHTLDDDGLAQPWEGRVWMNPPYSQPAVQQFAERLCDEVAQGNVTQACVLVNNATETAFFQRLASSAAALCFPSGRVQFWHPDKESAAPLQGQAVLYFGSEVEAFRREFAPFGFVVTA